MSWVAVAIGGGALIGGGASILASNKQSNSAQSASNQQMAMFQQTQQNLAPYMQAGQASLAQLRGLTGVPSNDGSVPYNPEAQLVKPFGLSDFQQSPAYQFNLDQGQNAINKAANARGNYYAPQTIQDISKFSQGLASNEFQNAFQNYNQSQQNIWNRLYSLSGSGQNAAAMTGGFGTNAANQVGANTIGAGNAQAAGIMGAGNAANNAIGQGYNAYLMNSILGQQQQGIGSNANSAASMPGGDYMTQLTNPAGFFGL